MKQIVYLSHGAQKYHDQTRYSVLTLLDLLTKQGRHDIKITIFTDRPTESPDHELVSSIYLAPDDLARFRGPLDYVHRIKLEVLRRAEAELGLPFIYVDGDTRWQKIPDEQFAFLADGRPVAYMHKLEGMVSANFFPQYWGLLRKKKEKLVEWNLLEEGPWPMWNSGTLGVPATASGIFDRALAITDDLLLDVGYRTCVEQIALSLLAGSQFQVNPFDDCLVHYWSYSFELPTVLQRFLQDLPPGLSITQQAERAGAFQISESELKAIQSASRHRFFLWRAKMQNSFYKRGIDVRAFWLRRRRAAVRFSP